LKTAADAFDFGRGPDESRRHTRFLYYAIVIDLLRGVLARGRLPTTHHAVSLALVRLFSPSGEPVKQALLNQAIEVLRAYLIQSGKNYLRDVGAYKGRFYFDLAVRAVCACDTSPSVLAS
jgi:hypothetical protein